MATKKDIYLTVSTARKREAEVSSAALATSRGHQRGSAWELGEPIADTNNVTTLLFLTDNFNFPKDTKKEPSLLW